jgi:hypothetical protein
MAPIYFMNIFLQISKCCLNNNTWDSTHVLHISSYLEVFEEAISYFIILFAIIIIRITIIF